MSLRLSHDETTRSTPVLSNNSKCLEDSSDSKATCGSVRNQELPLLIGAPAAKVANQWHHHCQLQKSRCLPEIFLPATLSPLCYAGCHRGHRYPTWHRTRRMLRHCGSCPPPPHLGRTLRARRSAIRLPWLPLASDSSCTPPARRHCSSVKNTHAHTYASIR